MTPRFRPRKVQRSKFQRLSFVLKENSWIVAIATLCISIAMTQYQLHVDRRVRVEAECRLAEGDGVSI